MQTHLRHTGFRAMGTYCEIQIFQASRIMAKRQVSRLIEEVKRLESKYTRYREDSFLSQINRGAGSQTGISIDFETQKLFEYAQRGQVGSSVLTVAWQHGHCQPTPI